MHETTKEIIWDQDVTIYNRVVLKQLGLAFGIPFGALSLYLCIQYWVDIKRGHSVSFQGVPFAFLLIGIWILLTALFLFVVYRNRFRMHYQINEDGIFMGFSPSTSRKNRLLNFATIIAGGFAGKPSIAGAGLLAQSNQSVMLRWEKCTRFRQYPKKHRITIDNKFIEFMIVECTPDNYQEVLAYITAKVRK